MKKLIQFLRHPVKTVKAFRDRRALHKAMKPLREINDRLGEIEKGSGFF